MMSPIFLRQVLNQRIFYGSRRLNSSISTHDIVKHNPYEELEVEIDTQTSQDKPIKITAYGDERTIACICSDMHFLTLKKGPPVKSPCGHWFQLIDHEKFWLKKLDS